ncbi:MAG: DUF535 family protein [Methylibium sp.]|uniref:VirK/YbjX family protein n=1 Tax=Methylibium sp. TaxID=2067992 RepID=UPI0017FCBE69|nr:DUF535 family protein [Methylibium sp.]MBA3597205.1 DUF535 family protein [Methylibium sp.]
MTNDWSALWMLSAAVCGRSGLGALKRRIVFMVESSKVTGPLQALLHPTPGSPLQRAMEQRPDMAGVVVWPYVCANWSTAERLRRVAGHFTVIETRLPVLDFSAQASLVLADLSPVFESLGVVLDRPKWFMREGQMALNLFLGDVRIYSLAFSLDIEEGRTIAHVGAIQGVATEGIQADYKELTKALHGMRPRDFLVELFRIFCRCAGVVTILAVADASRQHRSAYFGAAKAEKLTPNYDEIWVERGGVQSTPDFFLLGLQTPAKDLEEIPSKKRAMYRRRYEFLASLEDRMHEALGQPPGMSASPRVAGPALGVLAA